MGLLLKKRKRDDSDSSRTDEGKDGERQEGAGRDGVEQFQPLPTRRKPRTFPGKSDEHNTALKWSFKAQDKESKESSERQQSPKEGFHLPTESEAAPAMKRSGSATSDEQDDKGGSVKKQALQRERSPNYSDPASSAEKPLREAGNEDQAQSSGTFAEKSGGPEAVLSEEESATSATSQEQLITSGASDKTLLQENPEPEGPGSSAKEVNKEMDEEGRSSVLEQNPFISDEENQQHCDMKATSKDPFREFIDIVENLAELTNSTEEESGADEFVSSARWNHQESTQLGSQKGQTPHGASPSKTISRNDNYREEQKLDRRITSETVITIKEEPEDENLNNGGYKSMHNQSNSPPRLEKRSSTNSIDIKCVERHVLEEKCNRLTEEKSKLEAENRNLRERLTRESQASNQCIAELVAKVKRLNNLVQTASRQFKLYKDAISNFKLALKKSVLCLRKANIALTHVVDDDRDILHSLNKVQLGCQTQEEILSNLSSATAPKFRELVVLMLGTTFQRMNPLEATHKKGTKLLKTLAATVRQLYFEYANDETLLKHRTQAQQQSEQQLQAQNHQALTQQPSSQMRAFNEMKLLQQQRLLQQQQQQHLLQQQQQQQQRLPSPVQQTQDQRFHQAQSPPLQQQQQQAQQYQQQRQSFQNAPQSQQVPYRQHSMPYQQIQQPMQHYQQPMLQMRHREQTLPRHQF